MKRVRLDWWELHLTQAGWENGKRHLDFGRESPDTPAARDAVLTIRQDCYSDGEIVQRLVGTVQDRAKAKELLAKHPTLPDGSPVLALDNLEN
jgi:hypothetical protein